MSGWLERTEMLVGEEAIIKLKNAHVIIFGIGGVGGFAVEALARAGVGIMTLVDNDVVSDSNRNRQIIATVKTIGQFKTDVMKERILDINPEAVVHIQNCFVLPGDTMDQFCFTDYTYIIDAIDTVTAKLELVKKAEIVGTPIISCMGTGNKLDATRLEIADIYETSVCPLAKVMRKELRVNGISKLEVVYSKEEPKKIEHIMSEEYKRSIPGSVSFVPSVAGMLLGGTVIRHIISM